MYSWVDGAPYLYRNLNKLDHLQIRSLRKTTVGKIRKKYSNSLFFESFHTMQQKLNYIENYSRINETKLCIALFSNVVTEYAWIHLGCEDVLRYNYFLCELDHKESNNIISQVFSLSDKVSN